MDQPNQDNPARMRWVLTLSPQAAYHEEIHDVPELQLRDCGDFQRYYVQADGGSDDCRGCAVAMDRGLSRGRPSV